MTVIVNVKINRIYSISYLFLQKIVNGPDTNYVWPIAKHLLGQERIG